MISSRLTVQIDTQVADTRRMALASYVAYLEHAQALSQPQQPKQGTPEKGKEQ